MLLDFYFASRYLFCCSYSHNVAPKGKYIAFVSTEAETDQPEVELKPGIELLGTVDEIFFDIYDRYEPTNYNEDDNCYISTVSTCVFSLSVHLSFQSSPNSEGIITLLKEHYSIYVTQPPLLSKMKMLQHDIGNSGLETSLGGTCCEPPTVRIISKIVKF